MPRHGRTPNDADCDLFMDALMDGEVNLQDLRFMLAWPAAYIVRIAQICRHRGLVDCRITNGYRREERWFMTRTQRMAA